MLLFRRAALALLLALGAAATTAAQSPAPANAPANGPIALRGFGVDETLAAGPLLAPALDRARVSPADFPMFVRLGVEWPDLAQAIAATQWATLDARLAIYRTRRIPVLLDVRHAPIAVDRAADWPQAVRALATHLRGSVAGYQWEAERTGARPEPRTYAFFVKVAAVQIRAVDPAALVAFAGVDAADLAWLTSAYDEDLATATDVAPVVAATPAGATPEPGDALAPILALVATRDPTAVVLVTGGELAGADAGVRAVTASMAWLGARTSATTWTGSIDALAAALTAEDQWKDIFSGDLTALDEVSAHVTIAANGADVTATTPHRLLYNLSNNATYLAVWDAPREPLTIQLIDQAGQAPTMRDAIARKTSAVTSFSHDAVSKVSRLTVTAAAHPVVLDFNFGAPNTFASRADVSTNAALSVEEIIFRHQQAQAHQGSLYTRYHAALEMSLHFRPTPTDVFDVVSENRLYYAPDAIEWEELSFSVNGGKWGPDHPGLPLLQAEKVLSLPLDLRLTADYRYRLAGIETVDEHRCYVVDFEPVDASRALYRGRVWIDAGNFLRVKIDSVETHLTGEIVSNEQIATYGPVGGARGEPIYLPTHIATKQILLIAGRNLLLEKEERFSDVQIDPADFDARRAAARASNHVMFRDTDAGVRYLVHDGDARVVSDKITLKSKALAMGTVIDPTYAFPLPIFGINYLNFKFLGTDSQLALLFAGVFATGNIQKPKLGHTPFDGSVDFFVIAAPGADELHDAAGAHPESSVMSFPESFGANIGYQFTTFQKVTASYSFGYQKYFAGFDTAPDFVVPSSTVTHGIGAGYEYKRHGYSFGAGASTSHRMTWNSWGDPTTFDPAAQTFQLYSAGASKDVLIGPFQTVHVGAAYYGGEHLDRFSMYQFGLFNDVRMHGVPGSGVRFPALLLARGSYSFNVFDQYRLDLYLDQAWGRDPLDHTVWHPVTGTGVAVNFRTPWHTMFKADVGKSFLPSLYSRAGSVVLQFTLLKPLGS